MKSSQPSNAVSEANLYESDFFLWTQRTADLLRRGCLSGQDIQHVAEEIRDMGISQQKEASSRLGILLMHLAKWQIQPEKRAGSTWLSTIRTQRRELARLLRRMPSLRRYMEQELPLEYKDAVEDAMVETGVRRMLLPPNCPWTLDQVLDLDFLPG